MLILALLAPSARGADPTSPYWIFWAPGLEDAPATAKSSQAPVALSERALRRLAAPTDFIVKPSRRPRFDETPGNGYDS